jgi:hypothetical protein
MRCKLGLYFELREESQVTRNIIHHRLRAMARTDNSSSSSSSSLQLQLYTVSFVEEENGYIFLKGLEFDSFHYSKLVRFPHKTSF